MAETRAMVGSLVMSQLSVLCETLVRSVGLGFRLVFGGTGAKRGRGRSEEREEESECSEFVMYEGVVRHERRHPVRHQFEYKVRYVLVNLDNVPSWFSSSSRHHMTAQQARSIAGTSGPAYLLCMPTSVGYEQNPISLYYCYDGAETRGSRVVKAIAEIHPASSLCLSCPNALTCALSRKVTNTPWGERVTFVFDPSGDMVAKPLHVSPFMDMAGTWGLHAPVPGDKLSLTITVNHPEFGNFFVATLRAKRVETAQSPERFLWLMPQKVAIWIYWQALVLLWKGVSFVQHPKYVDGDVYRTRAQHRDLELRNKPAWQEANGPTNVPQALDEAVAADGKGAPHSGVAACPRYCTWQEAAGPPWL